MLQIIRRGQKWLLWLVIIFIGGVFTLYLGLGGGGNPANDPLTVVQVGTRSFDVRDVERLRLAQERQYRDTLGDGFDSKTARDFLIEQAGAALLRAGLLAEQAERSGMHVSDDEVRRLVRGIPGAVNDEGLLDRDAITNYAQAEFGSVKRWQDKLREDLLGQKFTRFVYESVDVSEAEAIDALRYRQEMVQVALVKFDGRSADEDVVVEDAEVEALIAADPARIEAAYEERRDEFNRPEEIRARHVLVQIPEGAGEAEKAAALAAAEQVRQRLVDGDDFAEVAAEVSSDPGSRADGGDLGFFPRGRMVAPFEDAAFALEAGQLSEVVETVHGYHVIRLEEKRAASVTPFEEARDEVARDLVRDDAAGSHAKQRAQELADEVAKGRRLVDVAREEELAILRPEFARRPDGFVPEVGASPELMTAAFALSADEPRDGKVHEAQDRVFVVMELIEKRSPDEAQLAAEAPAERTQLRTQRQEATLQQILAKLRDELEANGELLFNLEPLFDKRRRS